MKEKYSEEKIIFIEKFSLLRGILLARYIRKADKVLLFESMFPVKLQADIKKVQVFVKAIGEQAIVKKIAKEKINNLNWKINKRALAISDQLIGVYKESWGFWAIAKILKTNMIDNILKHTMLFYIIPRSLFITQATDLVRKGSNVIIVPEYEDLLGLEEEVLGKNKSVLCEWVPFGIRILNKLKNIVMIFTTLLKYIIYPLWLLHKYDIGRNNKYISAPYGIQVFRGISKTNMHAGKLVKGIDATFIYDNELFTPDRVVQYFWGHLSAQIGKEETKSSIKEMDGKYIDEADMKLDPKIFKQTVLYGCVLGIAACIRGVFSGEDREILTQSLRLLHNITMEMMLCSYISTRSFLSFDDQSVKSIIRTVLLNNKGIKHFGHQHSAQCGTYLLPHLAYTHFDKYLVYGRKYVDLFSPYWDLERVSIVGHWRSDFNYRSSKDAEVTIRFKEKYGNFFNIHVTPPGSGYKNVQERIDEFYKGLKSILSLDKSIHIIFRSRTAKLAETAKRQLCKEINDGRLTIELLSFNTYDLVVNSDLSISTGTSSIFIDAVSAGKDAIAFDFDDSAKLVYALYDPELVVKNANEMVSSVKKILQNKWDKAPIYKKIASDFYEYYDGKSIQRIRKLMHA